MIQLLTCEIIDVRGFKPAILGMRNPMNSWNKSDSVLCKGPRKDDFDKDIFCVGENDMKLMKSLCEAGTEHRKYLRMIQVWMDITAPLYWWKQFDTYKVGVIANSCSTMHKIADKEFTLKDFSYEHLELTYPLKCLDQTIHVLNIEREKYLKTKDKNHWWQMIQLLPSSYNQKRTVMLNYEVVLRIIEQRTNHKLDEWNQLIDTLYTLPYVKELTKQKRSR